MPDQRQRTNASDGDGSMTGRTMTLGTHVANGVIAFMFAASGPVAIIISAASRGGLPQSTIASWIFGAFVLNSVITVSFSLYYRQPLVFLWTIPGTVLVGSALVGGLTYPEVVGAYVAAGIGMLLLGLSGSVRRAMGAVPMPIVMAMVAGVFLQFCVDLVTAFRTDLWIAAPMTAAFVLLSIDPRVARYLPPLIVAFAVGAVAVWNQGIALPPLDLATALVTPELHLPEFSWRAMVELVVPLMITVLVVQNGQGVAVLTAAGHRPPVDAIAAACGVGSIVTAFTGAISTCLTGPVNAILASGGERTTQFAAALVVAVLISLFGLFSPLFVRLLLAAPPAFIAVLAGLAMLRVLQTAFVTAFSGRFALGALVTFLVTISGLSILNVGAPFWGLVIGFVASSALERADFAAAGAVATPATPAAHASAPAPVPAGTAGETSGGGGVSRVPPPP